MLDKVTATAYMSVRPILSSSEPGGQAAEPHADSGYGSQSYDAQEHSQVAGMHNIIIL